MSMVDIVGSRCPKRLALLLLCLSLPFVAFHRSTVMLRSTTERLTVSYDPSLATELESSPVLKVEDDSEGSSPSLETTSRNLEYTTDTAPASLPSESSHDSFLAAKTAGRAPESTVVTTSPTANIIRVPSNSTNVTNVTETATTTAANTTKEVNQKPLVVRKGTGVSAGQARATIGKASLKGPTNGRATKPKPPEKIHFFKVPGVVNPIQEKRIIYLMHIHKNAGSTMCKAATLNKVASSIKTNCNVQADQRCCGNNDTLAAQQYFARTTNLSFVAAERDMYEALDTHHYRYIIVLRKSHDRYLSHYKHVVRAVKYNQTFSTWWGLQPDNFSFRKVCGTKCSTVPKYHISEYLFNYTLDRLKQFDDYILQEDFRNSYIRFAQRVGWKLAPASIHNKSPNVRPGVYPGLTGWDPHMDALENALYEYAEQRNKGIAEPVFSETVQQELQSYFAHGPSRNCTLPCCAEKCSTYR